MAFVEGILAPWPWSEGPGGQRRASPVPSGKLGWASSSSLQVAAGLSLVPSGCSTSALSSRLRASSRARATVRFRRSEGWRRCWKSRGQSPAPVGPLAFWPGARPSAGGGVGGTRSEPGWVQEGLTHLRALLFVHRDVRRCHCPFVPSRQQPPEPGAPQPHAAPLTRSSSLDSFSAGPLGPGGPARPWVTVTVVTQQAPATLAAPPPAPALPVPVAPATTSCPRGTSVALLTGGPGLPLGPGWPGEPFSPCPRMRRKRKERRGAELLPHVPTVGTGLSRSPRMRTRGDRAPQQGSPRARCPRTHFLSRQALEEKSKGVPQGEAAGPADPMCWGGKGLTGFPGSPGSPRGPGGPASPCRGTRGRHTWPRWGISQPCSLISSPFPRLLFAGVFCTKGEESTPNTNPCPVPPHPTGTCGPLGPGLPGTPWGPCLP